LPPPLVDPTPSSEEIISSFAWWITRLRKSIGLRIISGVLDNADPVSIGISGCVCSADACRKMESIRKNEIPKDEGYLTWSNI
jgi:hypothetical protein